MLDRNLELKYFPHPEIEIIGKITVAKDEFGHDVLSEDSGGNLHPVIAVVGADIFNGGTKTTIFRHPDTVNGKLIQIETPVAFSDLLANLDGLLQLRIRTADSASSPSKEAKVVYLAPSS